MPTDDLWMSAANRTALPDVILNVHDLLSSVSVISLLQKLCATEPMNALQRCGYYVCLRPMA